MTLREPSSYGNLVLDKRVILYGLKTQDEQVVLQRTPSAPADQLFVRVPGSGIQTEKTAKVGWIMSDTPDDSIRQLPVRLSENYELLKPIPVRLTRIDSASYVALFVPADISMTGRNQSNAKEELAATIVDFLEVFQNDRDFQQEIAAIVKHIRVRNAEQA